MKQFAPAEGGAFDPGGFLFDLCMFAHQTLYHLQLPASQVCNSVHL